MKHITTLAIGFLLFSCSSSRIANRKLQRADRLIKQAIALGAVVKQDTVFVEKIIPGSETTVNVPIDRIVHNTDTFTVYQDKVKIHFKTVRDTLRLSVECPPDTIKIPVTVHRSIVAPPCPKDKFWKGFGMGAGLLLILLIILAVVRAIRG